MGLGDEILAQVRADQPWTQKPSAIIREQIAALVMYEKKPGVVIDMSVYVADYHGECHLCEAGAVFAARYGDLCNGYLQSAFARIHQEYDTYKWIRAMDEFRQGNCGDAFLKLGLDGYAGQTFNRDITPYQDSPAQHKVDMLMLAQDLEANHY